MRRLLGGASLLSAARTADASPDSLDKRLFRTLLLIKDGGPGSGNHNHSGRPGQVGGSGPGDGGKSTSWNKLGTSVKVDGPKNSRTFIKSYLKEHPEVKKDIPKYKKVLDNVKNFQRDHPGAEMGTYDAVTGKKVDDLQGYCVTFHQNDTAQNPYGAYTPEDYAALCAIAKHQLGSGSVNIGYFGNAEVSFTCPDERTAKQFAVEHNQHSIYNSKTGRVMRNKFYNPETNPIDFG